MELIFLGTSAGAPTKRRNMTAAAIRRVNGKAWCLIDCAEGTQHQILHTNLSLNNLEAVFITHSHGDHCYGLPGLLESASMCGRKQPLTIVGPAGLKDFILLLRAQTDLELSYPLEFIDVAALDKPVVTDTFSVQAVALSHRVPSHAYVFIETELPRKLNIARLNQDKVPAAPYWGQIQSGQQVTLPSGQQLSAEDYLLPAENARKVIVGGDNDSPELLAEAASDASLLVHEATFTAEVAARVGPAPQHSSARQVGEFAQQIGIPNLILTHFSSRYQYNPKYSPSINDIQQDAAAVYQGNLFLANDFDVYRLGDTGVTLVEQKHCHKAKS